MDKEQIRENKELQILASIYKFPEIANDVFNKISIDMISKQHQTLFQSLADKENLDDDAILWELELSGYEVDFIKTVANRLNGKYEILIKEHIEIANSIKVDTLLSEALKESKNSIIGGEILSNLKKQIESELLTYRRFDRPVSFNDSLERIIQRLQDRTLKSDSIKTKSFPSFNTATGGLNEGNLIGIAGAFKNGKTTFGLNLVLDIAGQNIPSVIFSLEMTKSEIEEKILAYRTGIPYGKIRNPQRLNDDEKLKIAHFYGVKRNFNEKLFLFDKVFSLAEIESKVIELSKQYGVKIVLVDYLGLIKSTSKNSDSREREISQLSNSLKILAKETDTVIFVLSQLNRSGIKEASSINLAESIALARESDFLFTIYKPELSGFNKIKINGKELSIGENDFVVKLDSSRHTQSGNQFLLSLTECGEMKEIQTQFDNSYLNRISEAIII